MSESNAILKNFGRGLSAAEIQDSIRTVDSIRTAKFLWHPFYPINNRDLQGNRFHVRYNTLARMSLIPIVAWDVPVLTPRSTGFAVGMITAAGAMPAAAVGSQYTTRVQLASQSVEMLLSAYKRFGLVDLESLTSDTDEGKSEAILLYEGVMNTPPAAGQPTGNQTIMEQLPDWLRLEAPGLLARALSDGVVYEGQTYRLSAQVRDKGRQMIADMRAGIKAAEHLVMNQSNGILPMTKKQLIGAAARIPDNKAQLDHLDGWLSEQYPSFSFDTAVERAARANREVIEAIQGSKEESGDAIRQLLETNNLLLQRMLDADKKGVKANKSDS